MADRRNKFLMKRSNVAGKVPSAGDILLGEMALNTADVILYASGTTANSILPIGWDRIHRTGDTMNGNFIINGDLTVTGTTDLDVVSATTYYGDGSNLTGIVGAGDTYSTGATFIDNLLTITNNTGGTFNVGVEVFTGVTVNGITTTEKLVVDNTGSTVSISNPNSGDGLILEGIGGVGNTPSTLRIVSNDNAWTDNVTTSYFQIDTANGIGPDYVTFMGGTYGTDTPFSRLQFNSSGTTFSDCPFGDTPVPTGILDIVVKNPTTKILNLIGATGQTGDYFNITTNGGTNGDVFKVDSNKDADFGGRILSGGTDISTLWGGGSFTGFTLTATQGSPQDVTNGQSILFNSGSGLTASIEGTRSVVYRFDIDNMISEPSPTTGDKLLLYDTSTGQHKNIDWSDLPGAGGGETNTGANVGVGAGQIFRDKTGTTINFRTLQSSGATVTITTDGDIVNLESSGGGSSRIESSTTTTDATPTELEKINTLTDNATNIVEVYVKAYSTAGLQWGVWKRTLTVTKTLGAVTIQEVNADVDKTSTGLKANDVTFTVNGGDIDVDVTGIAATIITWNSAYEIIL